MTVFFENMSWTPKLRSAAAAIAVSLSLMSVPVQAGGLLGVIVSPGSVVDASAGVTVLGGGGSALNVPVAGGIGIALPSLSSPSGGAGVSVGLVGGGSSSPGGAAVSVGLGGGGSSFQGGGVSGGGNVTLGDTGGSRALGLQTQGNRVQIRSGFGANVASLGNSGGVDRGRRQSPDMSGSSSRLRLLASVLNKRAWMKFAANGQVCLPYSGVASMSGWLPARERDEMDQLLAYHSRDISALRSMMLKCGKNSTWIGRSTMSQAIGLDMRNGEPVLFTE